MAVKSKRSYRSEARAASVDEGRERMIVAARKLLAGGRNVPSFSLDAVAREAGVTRLTIYNQFASKRGLLEAVFDTVAREGGLFELSQVIAEPDLEKALRRVVAVFAKFWATHGLMMPKLSAFARLDEEIATSLKERSERRRQLLQALVGRMSDVGAPEDLIDVLFSLTSAEFFHSLLVRRRSLADVEELIWELIADALRRSGGLAPR